MAEIKRVPLQSAPLPDASKQSAKKSDKKKDEKEKIVPSFRFALTLPESNEEKCPEVNYSELLKNAEKKKKKEKKKEENNTGNGLSVFDENADDDKILDVARYFEQKYGKRKKSDYVDLGAGYDESDSFIDNTDAYDEIVPEEVTTVHGGFYVNSGPLEFKDSNKLGQLRRNLHNNGNGNDEDGDEDESEEDNTTEEDSDENEETTTSKPVNKRTLSSSDELEESSRPLKAKTRKEDPTEINLV